MLESLLHKVQLINQLAQQLKSSHDETSSHRDGALNLKIRSGEVNGSFGWTLCKGVRRLFALFVALTLNDCCLLIGERNHMKKITLLILTAMFCIGTLTLLGCADESEVVEPEPVEEAQEEPDVEEVVELEPEVEVIESETVEQKVSDAELEAAIRQLASNDPYNNVTLQRGLDRIVDLIVHENVPNNLIYDTSMDLSILIRLDRNHNNFELLRTIRDNQENATLIELYNDLIDIATKERNGEISMSEYIMQTRPIADTLRNSDIRAYDAMLLGSMHVSTLTHVPGDTMVTLDGNSYSLMQLYGGSTEDKQKAPLVHIYTQLIGRARNGQDLNAPIGKKDLVRLPNLPTDFNTNAATLN